MTEENRGMDKSQAYFWSDKWQQTEKEADEDIRSGQVKAFDNAEDLIDELD